MSEPPDNYGTAEGNVTGDLVARLTRVLDEDERLAKCPRHSDWAVEPWTPSEPGALPGSTWVVAAPDGDPGIAVCNGSYTAEHIVRHDPTRTLRTVAAHRTILKSYEDACERVRNPVSADARTAARAAQFELEEVIRALAEAYGVAVKGKAP